MVIEAFQQPVNKLSLGLLSPQRYSFFFIFIRMYFIGILSLKFPKFEEYVKNVPEAEIFHNVFLHVEEQMPSNLSIGENLKYIMYILSFFKWQNYPVKQ